MRAIWRAERSYGPIRMHLMVGCGYLTKLLGDVRLVWYLAHHHPAFLAEFQRVADGDAATA